MQTHFHTGATPESRKSVCWPFLFLFSLAVWIVSLFDPPYPELLAADPENPPVLESCTAHAPVTNECVEAGLRAKRERIRAEPPFQVRTPATHLQLAERFNQQGDPNGAIEEYQAAIQIDPTLAEAYRGLGAVHLDTHQWKEAEDALRTSTGLDPTDSQTFYWLGRARMAQLKFADALDAFRTATELNPGDAEAFSDLGLTFMAQGHSTEAIKAFRQAIRLRPDFSEAHSRLELAKAFTAQKDQLVQETAKILQLLFKRE